MSDPNIVQRRPAETTTGAAAIALLIAYFAGLDDTQVVLALSVVIGLLPALVTWLVTLIRGH